ncbi:MAG: hypothetical protein ROY99_06350 [Ignavibacterium sp.]|jgi:hypothetical protein|nr:hypothetical protein [Ignavibacterium sp.]
MKFFIYLSIIFSILNLTQQNNLSAQTQQSADRVNQLYLELGGNGLIYSVNYERFLSDNFTIRGGFGITPGIIFAEGTFIHIPFTISYLIGGVSSKFEAGLGATYFSGTDVEIFGLPAGDQSLIFMTGVIGYRYTSPAGFAFRIFFTPLYSKESDPDFIPTGGLSFGFLF